MESTVALLPDGAWLDRLDPAFLAAAYPSWAAAAADFDAAADAFRVRGFPALAAPAADLAFDPDYYREANPAWDGADDSTCFRHWLVEGLAAGRPGSAAAHLRRLNLALDAYPAAFPWRAYARLRPAAGAHRWAALEDFCDGGFAELGERVPYGHDAIRFLSAVGRRYSVGDDALAIRAYELARSYGPLPVADLQHLADAYLRRALWRPALTLYDAISRGGGATCWTLRNLAKCATRLNAAAMLLAAMYRTAPMLREDALWPVTVAEALDTLFAVRANVARAMLADGDASGSETLLADLVHDLVRHAEHWLAARLAEAPPGPVVILANQDDPDSAERCVGQLRRLLDRLGLGCAMSRFDAPEHSPPLAGGCAALVLFRTPALPSVILAIATARRLGAPLFYMSDTTLPDLRGAPSLESFRGRLQAAAHEDLLFGCALRRIAARLCDGAIAPTPRLAAALGALVRAHRSLVLPSAPLPAAAARPTERRARLRLFLQARTLTHLDAEPGSFGDALLGFLVRDPKVELRVSGPVHLDRRFDTLGDRVLHLGGSVAPAEHRPELADADVGLAFAGGEPDEEYRAELAWADAASLGVPSVLAAPEGAVPAVRHGANSLRAATPEAFAATLGKMAEDAALRARLAKQARSDLVGRTDVATAVDALRHFLTAAPTDGTGHAV
jgi:hypothetical protein